jgi:ribosomal protein S18 acetylase RimI-like enzyme
MTLPCTREGGCLEIRPFAGTWRDAQGLVEVDGETFHQCHYTPGYLVQLLSEPGQWAAVALDGATVVGFVSAFATQSLAGRRWEVDELAVRPAYQGRGLGTRLVASALQQGAVAGPPRARVLVARDNLASRRAFEKNGFRAHERVDLLLYEIGGRVPRPPVKGAPPVREAVAGDAAAVASLGGYAPDDVLRLIADPGHVYLVAEGSEGLLGCTELVEVHTLQYRGFWLERLLARPDRARASAPEADADSAGAGWAGAALTSKALANAALEAAKRRADLDLVGHLASPADRDAYAACISEGFRHMGAHYVLVRDLDR